MYKVYTALVHLGNWAPGQLGVLGSWALGLLSSLLPLLALLPLSLLIITKVQAILKGH
jgi:hypothetical protein